MFQGGQWLSEVGGARGGVSPGILPFCNLNCCENMNMHASVDVCLSES